MKSSGNPSERRLFSRVRCSLTATLRQGDGVWKCNVADISLNGALLELPQDLTIQSGDDVRLELIHPQTKKLALADAVVVHTKAGHAGCRFTEIDPESIERLRELLLWLVTEES
jgi:hypothetical protein